VTRMRPQRPPVVHSAASLLDAEGRIVFPKVTLMTLAITFKIPPLVLAFLRHGY